MGVNHTSYILYGYKAAEQKPCEDIPEEIREQASGEYPGAIECLETLYNEYRDINYRYINTNMIASGGDLYIGTILKKQRNHGATQIQNPEQLNAELPKQLKHKIKKIIKPENPEPLHFLIQTIG
jgi:hypothetical protein